MQKSQAKTPKRVQFAQGFVFQGRQMLSWPSEKHKDVSCRVVGETIQLLDKRKGELAIVFPSGNVVTYDAKDVE